MRKKPKFQKLLASLSALALSGSVYAMGAPASSDSYHLKSLKDLAARGGVDHTALEKFYFTLNKAPATHSPSADCVDNLEDSSHAREDLLDCVGARGSEALNADLGEALFAKRRILLQINPTRENLRTLALIAYLEDLVREKLRLEGQSATWIQESGYLKGSQKTDFDFEDGDVVLGLGNTSISSLISQITNTPSRYSHAFIVRKRGGKITTVESLIETGVREFPLEHLLKDPYNQLTVLRWKDEATRLRIATRASDWAKAAAVREAPYDMKMDFSEDVKIYCSELIVKAYANAAGIRPEALIRHQSRIESEQVFNFARQLGVSNKVFFAPGDIFNSEHFEVVADYRKPGDLMKSWELYLMGDLFIERLNKGYEVTPGPLFSAVPLAVWIGQLLPSIFHEDARLIPKSIGPRSMSVMATTQIWIYDRSVKDLNKRLGKTRNLLDTPPWKIRGEFERSMDTTFTVRQSFTKMGPKKKIVHTGRPR